MNEPPEKQEGEATGCQSQPAHRHRPCPICGKPAEPRFRPFCSRRCADVDLGRWFGEAYRIPGVDSEDDDAADPSPPADPDTRG